jgi:hypothetical protein
MRSPKGFYFVAAENRCGEAVQAFREWLLAKFEGVGRPAEAGGHSARVSP